MMLAWVNPEDAAARRRFSFGWSIAMAARLDGISARRVRPPCLTAGQSDRIGRGIEVSSETAQAGPPRLRVIEPKLMLPKVHPRTLRRARLLDMLDREGSPLTVLDAGVGYGKTTLVRSWSAERPEAVIWMTLDAADDDPVRLWTHLATAVERLAEGSGRAALSALGVRGAAVETAVDELMNGLVAYGQAVAVVLDDLHTVKSEASARSIAHAIERLPENVCLSPRARIRRSARTATSPQDAYRDPRARTGVHGRRSVRADRP
jgi:hypothetical protein